ncbi:uncharacterized protein CELE_F52H2.3 [Caenorhabditis elegans]|uniref:Uncharacterized protein n=1 Tax=Caenorhabditis elegans TaxID=6239 RepID=O17393_CAEEL|nr:Uncharacterized protein CELE_F52H2.3 [Caenorhabditis elegans]CCD71658.1 Uncharacterized protein CELE_F52H2.3 [Caenorhabditis elegans]|eukprot:NP_508459.1 Uncharacterized protein CELE_F52H2.3 [Caenorhabditis elegans]
MAEIDQHCPTTSTYHRPTMEEAVVKMKRLQRFTRQFSIFVHCEEDKLLSSSENAKLRSEKQDENNEERLFKYPGNLRAIKRKRNISNESIKNVGVESGATAKRRMMEHQKSIRDGDPEDIPIEKDDDDKIVAQEKKQTEI